MEAPAPPLPTVTVTGLVGQVVDPVKYPPAPPPPPILPPPPPPPAITTYSIESGEPEVLVKVPELVKV
jgi:hypothetical protein